MSTDTTKQLLASLERADRLASAAEPFSALAELGAALGSIGLLSASKRESMRSEIETRVAQIIRGGVAEIQQSAEEHAERLDRILAQGGKLLYEEIVLLLTLRIELALVDRCLQGLAGIGLENTGADADEALEAVGTRPDSAAAYRSAVTAIEKNWRARMPFDIAWVGVEHLLSTGRREN